MLQEVLAFQQTTESNITFLVRNSAMKKHCVVGTEIVVLTLYVYMRSKAKINFLRAHAYPKI